MHISHWLINRYSRTKADFGVRSNYYHEWTEGKKLHMNQNPIFRWLEVWMTLTNLLTLRPRAVFSLREWPWLETWEGVWDWEGCWWRSQSPASHGQSHSWWRLYAGSHYSCHTREERFFYAFERSLLWSPRLHLFIKRCYSELLLLF